MHFAWIQWSSRFKSLSSAIWQSWSLVEHQRNAFWSLLPLVISHRAPWLYQEYKLILLRFPFLAPYLLDGPKHSNWCKTKLEVVPVLVVILKSLNSVAPLRIFLSIGLVLYHTMLRQNILIYLTYVISSNIWLITLIFTERFYYFVKVIEYCINNYK